MCVATTLRNLRHKLILVLTFLFMILFQMYAAEGRFTFTSHTAGEHQICLHSNSTAWFGGGKLVSVLWCETILGYFFISSCTQTPNQIELRGRSMVDATRFTVWVRRLAHSWQSRCDLRCTDAAISIWNTAYLRQRMRPSYHYCSRDLVLCQSLNHRRCDKTDRENWLRYLIKDGCRPLWLNHVSVM